MSKKSGLRNRTPNILLVTRPINPPWDEASKNFAWELARGLKDFQFHLLTAGGLKEKVTAARERENITEHPVYSSPVLRLNFAQKLRLLDFLTRKLPADLDWLHFLFTPSPMTTAVIKKLVLRAPTKTKTIQTVATLDFFRINKKNVRSYLFADKIVTHSDHSCNFLKGLGLKNVERIYPGVDLMKFKPRPKPDKLRAKLGIGRDDKVVLYTGEYVRLGGMEAIMGALPLMAEQQPHLKLILACRIKSEADQLKKLEIQQEIKRAGREHQVIFLETFANMKQLYNLADVFIFPVKKMTGKFDIALTVIEALASGLPSVIADIKPLNEGVKRPGAAVMLKKVAAQELAEAVLGILKDEARARELAQEARRNAEEFFDINKSIKAYRDVYQAKN